jgi:hypothetical protein
MLCVIIFETFLKGLIMDNELIKLDETILSAKNEDILELEWPEEIEPYEKVFISFYVSDAHWDGYKAWMMSKLPECKNKSATVQKANRLLAKPYIQQAIKMYVNSIMEINKTRAAIEILEFQRNRALYDPADIIDANGRLKYDSLDELPLEARMAIDGIETKYFGKDADRKVTTVKLANRDRAITDLKKTLRLDEESAEEKADRTIKPVIHIEVKGTPQVSVLPE